MPSTTEKQRRFIGVDLARLRAGRKTETGVNERQLEEFARKPTLHDRASNDRQATGRGRMKKLTPSSLLIRRLRFGSEWL